MFSQSHFSSKELNSTEHSAKKCKRRVGVHGFFFIFRIFLKTQDNSMHAWPMLARKCRFKHHWNQVFLFQFAQKT